MAKTAVSGGGNVLQRLPSGNDIMIGLEDEQGEQLPVEIDEADETMAEKEEEIIFPERRGTIKRRVSITERMSKLKNSEQQLQEISKEAEQRKRDLVELLSEHAQLVHVVDELEEDGSASSASLLDLETVNQHRHLHPTPISVPITEPSQST